VDRKEENRIRWDVAGNEKAGQPPIVALRSVAGTEGIRPRNSIWMKRLTTRTRARSYNRKMGQMQEEL